MENSKHGQLKLVYILEKPLLSWNIKYSVVNVFHNDFDATDQNIESKISSSKVL